MTNSKKLIIAVIMAVQVACTVFFVSEIFLKEFGVTTRLIPVQGRQNAQIGAALGLSLGIVMGWVALRRSIQHTQQVEEKLRVASGAFMDLLEERFTHWGLTPAERDVALFAIKGLSTHDIADLRNTSEGTVKAQSNAIYRKAGVSGRPQLLSLFIEDLMSDTLPR
ncbi:helix-turn-helix transcriptional regulator [Thalassovita taeanensis]|uniref:helix-turn-helix transcriptional regulator n=1 Tax=Thalassovita taeanensis TaxID=657014 RepID=UPI001FE66457|nr:helix-turn-helix transcriptional regulator [Thalassovita taeanensis]